MLWSWSLFVSLSVCCLSVIKPHFEWQKTSMTTIYIKKISWLFQERSNIIHKTINQSPKSRDAPDPRPVMHHSWQNCSEWSIVGEANGALWNLWILSIGTLGVFHNLSPLLALYSAKPWGQRVFRMTLFMFPLALTGVLHVCQLLRYFGKGKGSVRKFPVKWLLIAKDIN